MAFYFSSILQRVLRHIKAEDIYWVEKEINQNWDGEESWQGQGVMNHIRKNNNEAIQLFCIIILKFGYSKK